MLLMRTINVLVVINLYNQAIGMMDYFIVLLCLLLVLVLLVFLL